MTTKAATHIIIRKAQQDDLNAVGEFITPFIGQGKLLPRTHGELEDLMETLFIALLDERIVGCAALEIYSKKLAEIRSLAVSPAVQGVGIGRMLVQACLELARQKDILEVMAITSSDAFFKACGFDFTLPGEKKALFYQTRDI